MMPSHSSSAISGSLEAAADRFRSGDLSEAGRFCETVLESQPDEVNALHILGVVRLRQGDPETAVDLLQRAHRRDPRNAEIMINHGAALRANGKAGEAAKILRKAVRRAPTSPSAHLNLANALADVGEADRAERHYRRVLQLDPGHRAAQRALADLVAAAGRASEALSLYEDLGVADAGNPSLLNATGALHAEMGNFDKAGDALRRALDLDPANIDVAENLANVLASQFRHGEALPLYARVLAAAPGCPDTLSNAANGFVRGVQENDALDCFRRALAISPDHLDANAGLANFMLARGRYTDGWTAYLKRSSIAGMGPGLHRTALPSDLSGCRVCIVADQGLGDEIFFLRFVTALKRRGATVTYRPEPRLTAMLRRAGVADAIMAPDEIPRSDYILAVGDLPHALGMADGDAPPPSISLAPLGENRERLRSILETFGPPPWTAVTWRAGTPNQRNLLSKEVPMSRLADALAGISGSVVAVQRGAREGEVADFAAQLGRPVLDLSHVNDDLEDMLALAGLLDRYAAVSNTMVHLRAACGRTSHILVPLPADFRWMAAGEESPWFPGTRVYRQSTDGNWGGAFDALARNLSR